MTYGLGVDLGTTFTAAAVRRGDRVERFRLGDRSDVAPSVVMIRQDGAVLTGAAAERRATVEPERVAREFKRKLGDPVPTIVGGSPMPVPALLAHLLRAVVAKVAAAEGAPAETVTLTHPASWNTYQKEIFAQVPQLAEVSAVRMVTEPEAAAATYASNERLPVGATVAVYDLGGGTFDATVLRRTGSGFEILGTPQGIQGLGGIDFDQAVFAHVRESLGGDALAGADRAALYRLRQECVHAKEALSVDTDVTVPVLLPGTHTHIRLTRGEFEDMVRPVLADTMTALRGALRSAEIDSEDLTAVLLVGGSSKIPLVAKMVSAEFKAPIAVDTDPEFAVALGAAALSGAVGPQGARPGAANGHGAGRGGGQPANGVPSTAAAPARAVGQAAGAAAVAHAPAVPQRDGGTTGPRPTGPGTDPRASGPGVDARAAGYGTDTRSAGPGTDTRSAGPGTDPRTVGPGPDPRAVGHGSDPRVAGHGTDPRSVRVGGDGPGGPPRPPTRGGPDGPAPGQGESVDSQTRMFAPVSPGTSERRFGAGDLPPELKRTSERRWVKPTLFALLAAAVVGGGTYAGLHFLGGTSGQTGTAATTTAEAPTTDTPTPVAFGTAVATVPVGKNPGRIALTHDGAHAYTTNNGSNDVSVVDTATNTVVAAVPVGEDPVLVAVSPDDTKVYVTSIVAGQLSVIDVGANTVSATVPVGKSPVGIAVSADGATVYVANRDSNSISVVDAANATVTGTIRVPGGPFAVALSPDGTTAYVTGAATGTLSVVDLERKAVTGTVEVGSNPGCVKVGPDPTRVYVTSYDSATTAVVDVHDATNPTVVDSISVGQRPAYIAMAPDGAHAYVVNQGEDTISELDLSTNTVSRTFPVSVPAPNGMATNPDGTRGYVVSSDGNSLLVFSLEGE